jgi:DHA2 family multidrug resistance protein
MMWVGLPQLVIMPLIPQILKWIDQRVVIGLGLGLFGLSGLLMSHLTADSGHDQLVMPQIVRALGLPLIIVPLSLLTTGNVGRENAANASGLFNMLRNLGGSIGIASLSALLTQREHFHSHHLGEAISLYNPLTRDRIDALSQNFTTLGIDAATAQDRAAGTVDAVVRQQAFLLAFNDCFYLVSLLLLAAIVLCKKVVTPQSAGGAMGH